MKIYLSGSIRGGRELQGAYQTIADQILSLGHSILTYHVTREDVLEIEEKMTSREIYDQDIKFLEECDCMIAEVSVPSLGVGYEVAVGLLSGKDVLCIYDKRYSPISAMIEGNSHPKIKVREYSSLKEACELVENFLITFS